MPVTLAFEDEAGGSRTKSKFQQTLLQGTHTHTNTTLSLYICINNLLLHYLYSNFMEEASPAGFLRTGVEACSASELDSILPFV